MDTKIIVTVVILIIIISLVIYYGVKAYNKTARRNELLNAVFVGNTNGGRDTVMVRSAKIIYDLIDSISSGSMSTPDELKIYLSNMKTPYTDSEIQTLKEHCGNSLGGGNTCLDPRKWGNTFVSTYDGLRKQSNCDLSKIDPVILQKYKIVIHLLANVSEQTNINDDDTLTNYLDNTDIQLSSDETQKLCSLVSGSKNAHILASKVYNGILPNDRK